MPKTKWDFLSPEERASLDNTALGVCCASCDVYLATEGSFARHFYITDSRYLNLGYCPNRLCPSGQWFDVTKEVRPL